jgi:hypothetical protein
MMYRAAQMLAGNEGGPQIGVPIEGVWPREELSEEVGRTGDFRHAEAFSRSELRRSAHPVLRLKPACNHLQKVSGGIHA